MSEGAYVSVALPGPWWTLLSYRRPPELREAGVRVRGKVNAGARVGVALAIEDSIPDGFGGEIFEILEVIDRRPLLPDATTRLVRWFAETYLCGVGTAMKTLLPAAFIQGEPPLCEPVPLPSPSRAGPLRDDVSFLYEPVDAVRLARYARILSDGAPSLICFPLYADAKKFFEHLMISQDFPDRLRGRLFLYPRTGARAEWKAWSALMGEASPRIVIGAQIAATAPIPGLARVIVEDESNNVWWAERRPSFNVRSLLSMRARFEGAALVLGGRMPSSRACLRLGGPSPASPNSPNPPNAPKTSGRIFYVDLRDAYAPAVRGVADSLAVSEPLVRETNAALERGAWAVWILDRKGYAGEILCGECGDAIRCPRCGCVMRWEAAAARVRCVSCGTRAAVPEVCPRCRGRLLEARRPGLEALLPLARSAIHRPVPIRSLEAEANLPDEVLSERAGLLLGTRGALALCDALNVGLIGWIDPDGEARSQGHDARVRAFALIWESCWRGLNPEARRVLIQSRRPGKAWQRGLSAGGWEAFWRGELRERRQFGLPPFVPLIRLEAAASDARALTERLERAGLEHWAAEESGAKREIWVRTKQTALLRATLEPFFGIGRARRGYPSVTVWYE